MSFFNNAAYRGSWRKRFSRGSTKAGLKEIFGTPKNTVFVSVRYNCGVDCKANGFPVRCCKVASPATGMGSVEGELMAIQNAVFPAELQSAKANPSKACCLSLAPRPHMLDIWLVPGFAIGRHTARVCGMLGILVLWILGGCHNSKREPTTVSYLRLGWSQPDDLPEMEPLLQQFTRETGIRVRDLPVPETTLDQLDLSRRLLKQAAAGPDVLAVDVIWPGVLQPDLVDLQHDVAEGFPALEPHLLRSYEADGKLAAVPYTVQVGVLQYRRDLLPKYGYQRPPRTWDELEKMAARIQGGERAKGNKDFWGYVWQGAASEALTCNAIEWQAAADGGRVIESNRTISVNNPAAIRSWQRAKHWIGWISPPSVLAYQELDSVNIFDKGGAAFGHIWGGASITGIALFRQMHWRNSLAQSITGYTTIPGGLTGGAGTLGGSGLAVSQHSSHRREAIELVRFLIRAQIQSNPVDESAVVHEPGFHSAGSVSVASPTSETTVRAKLVLRPSSETGSQYEQVARAYIDTVHSVLNGEKSAPEAAAALEKKLVRITGFPIGPPLKED